MPLDTIRVYHLSMMKICADDLECNTGYSLTPSQLPIMFNSGKTGVVGDIGTGLGIQNLWNILSPTNEDIAEIGVQQGTDGSISISIEDLAHLFPTGTLTGFTIGHDPLIDFSTLITNATLKTYLDGVLQATISGFSLLDLKLTTFPLASFPEGTHHIGFKAEESFNEIQFIWEGTTHSGPIKIYQVLPILISPIETVC